jgi:hypothetical protein
MPTGRASLRYLQPRVLSHKASDEFTMSLCRSLGRPMREYGGRRAGAVKISRSCGSTRGGGHNRKSNEVDSLLGDASKARAKLGWGHKTSFDTLVADMVDGTGSPSGRAGTP